MKKVVPVSALAAALAASVISAAPSYAAPFQNCTEARNAGVVNIHFTSPNYSPDLDGNGDGWACEAPGFTPGSGTVPQPAVPQPAPAAQEPWAWDNCSEAFAHGVANIPAGTPGYGTHLDSDLDGIGCELNGDDSAGVVPENLLSAHDDSASQAAAAQGSQVEQIPVGGADTGAPVEQASTIPTNTVGIGVIGLAALTLGGLALRRSRAA